MLRTEAGQQEDRTENVGHLFAFEAFRFGRFLCYYACTKFVASDTIYCIVYVCSRGSVVLFFLSSLVAKINFSKSNALTRISFPRNPHVGLCLKLFNLYKYVS